jgi:tRNA pseudouridine55 synthase
MHGALVVDKPKGPTSHDVVARVRRATGIRRVGHTGALDPMATGVLVLLTGRATRLARFLGAGHKVYDATVRLGVATNTYDAEGTTVLLETTGAALRGTRDRAAVEAALAGFLGAIRQTPPPFSAKKIAGTRAYALARRRAPVLPAPATVTVHALELVALSGSRLDLHVVSSGGFYVRSLAHDLGVRLGCGAHLEALRRTRTGGFDLEQAVPLSTLEAEGLEAVNRIVPMADLLGDLPGIILTERGARRAAHGNTVLTSEVVGRIGGTGGAAAAAGPVRLLDRGGALLAIAEPDEGAPLHPVVVLV